MGLMQKLFGGGVAAAPSQAPQSRSHAPSRPGSDGSSVPPAGAMRRELLRLALRHSLVKNGIPTSWIAFQPLDVVSPDGSTGVHIRLILQHWEPRFLPFTLSFQHDMQQRLLAVEPQAHDWLRGVSWQYPPGAAAVPPMPDPATWAVDSAPVQAAPVEPAPVQLEPPRSGPVRKSKQELALLFAKQERGRANHGHDADFAPTQPVKW